MLSGSSISESPSLQLPEAVAEEGIFRIDAEIVTPLTKFEMVTTFSESDHNGTTRRATESIIPTVADVIIPKKRTTRRMTEAQIHSDADAMITKNRTTWRMTESIIPIDADAMITKNRTTRGATKSMIPTGADAMITKKRTTRRMTEVHIHSDADAMITKNKTTRRMTQADIHSDADRMIKKSRYLQTPRFSMEEGVVLATQISDKYQMKISENISSAAKIEYVKEPKICTKPRYRALHMIQNTPDVTI